ncbi:conserved protein of unknown function (plasmid) [Rhodovastum atsumiense]|uniref:DUF3987 domain-containing protein n=1 Tax=Rhodovastum atsumiense TaxID=504468 RepID=A0A5M6IIQ0_9PROT|nr:DUF3987 domain-containing protein [Rhodovastum atsumiense]KAA5608084.1 DUF3987 domain-containing protein [Rhodovastum atsumiense]CAH2606530.1 conserved protein of unknown function [Rhodovastum atsumiense]
MNAMNGAHAVGSERPNAAPRPINEHAIPLARLPIRVSRFTTATPTGPAMGDTERLTWKAFTRLFGRRREGSKDGPNIVLATFRPEPDGRVRRLKANVTTRTAIALDLEMNKDTGDVPPPFPEAVARVKAAGWAGVVYTSHNHDPEEPRYRIVLPLSEEIAPDLPAPEVVAELLGLRGVLDESKLGASSVFYLPSGEPGRLAHHETEIIPGRPVDAGWMRENAGALLARREAERERLRAEALAEAERRRAERRKQGYDPDASIIEAVRDRLDLEAELVAHGYERKGEGRYLYPGSETGVPGVYVLRGSDGIQRAYSHHAADPLAAGNLPSWCRAKAVDAVDVVTILDHGGDLKTALRELAKRFGIETRARRPEEPPPPSGYEGPEAEEEIAPPAVPAQRREGDTASWPEPLDFLTDAELTGVPELRPDHIPTAIAPFVFDTAARMGVDPAAVALSALVSLASVISDEWQIQPKAYDDTWTEAPRIWGAIVGDPSMLKTPIIRAATAPIDKMEAEARERHDQAMRRYRAEMKAWKEAGSDPEAEPKSPRLDRYLVEGTTTEALTEALRDDWQATQHAPAGKVLVRQDEMSEWIASFDRYRSGGRGGADRGAYLRLYNGGRFTIDRVNRGTFAVPNWSACVLGGIQPGPIRQIASEAADDGLLQRFCYCVPAHQGRGEDRRPNGDALARYRALFPALAALKPPAGFGNTTPRPVVLHAEAHAHRLEVLDLAEALAAMPDASDRLKSALGKWPGLWARLTLLFHLIELADARARGEGAFVDNVSRGAATTSTRYMRDILLPHLLRAEAVMFATAQTGHARWIAGFILSRGEPRIATRDIIRAYRALQAPEKRKELQEVMASLEAMGWVRAEPAREGREVTAWEVNPLVHTGFAARAQQEREAREATKTRIRATLERHLKRGGTQ